MTTATPTHDLDPNSPAAARARLAQASAAEAATRLAAAARLAAADAAAASAATEAKLAARVAELTAELNAVTEYVTRLGGLGFKEKADAEAARLRELLATQATDLGRLRKAEAEATRLNEQLGEHQAEIGRLRHALVSMRASRSWRATAPVRSLLGALGLTRGQGAG